MPDFNLNDETTEENTIIELNTMDEETASLDVSEVEEISDTELKVSPSKKKKDKKNKKSLKEKWEDLPKGGKIAIIVVPCVLLLILVAVLLWIFVFKDKDENNDLDEDEIVIIERENYKYENGKLIFLDENDKELGKYECKDKDVEKCYVATLSNEDNFDIKEYRNTKNEKIDRTSKILFDRFVFVYDDKKISLYDMKDKESTGDYELIKTGDTENKLVVVKDKKGKYGILSFKASGYEELIKPSFEYLGIIDSEDTFVAKEGNMSFLVNDTGKQVTSNINGEIRKFDAKYISVYASEKYALYDYKGTKLIYDDAIEYIDFKDGFIFMVRNGRLFGYDDTLFKITETGVKVKGEQHRPILVFDDKNKYKETKQSFKVNVEDGKIIVESNGNERELNIYESVVSKQIPYISYYDGSLFFYADEEKTDLIGSYTCSNKNVVTSTTTELGNCKIATSTNIINKNTPGYLPIINKNYVFIYDTKSDAKEPTVVLYDINAASSKATYQAVDIESVTSEISFVDSIDDLIYALSYSGKYGIIKIKTTGPQKMINFEYNKLELLKNKYLIGTKSNEYYLFDLEDLNVDNYLAKSKFPITDYSYGNLVVTKDKKYTIYNDSGKIVNNGFDYVKLESEFVIGVKGTKLNIYPYEADASGILKNDIVLETVEYKDGNIIVSNASGYVVTIKKSDGTTQTYSYNNKGEPLNDEKTPEDDEGKGVVDSSEEE